MKKRNMACLLLAMFIATFLTGCQGAEKGITAGQLKHQEEFRLHEIAWGNTVEEVEKLLPYAMERNMKLSMSGGGAETYVTTETVVYDGTNAVADLEFVDGKLAMIRLRLSVETDAKKWYDDQLEKLEGQFGQAVDSLDNDLGRGSKWTMGSTMLQIVCVDGTSVMPSVQIALGDLALYEQSVG